MAAPLFTGYEIDPSMLADAVNSTLVGVFTSTSRLATQLTRHAHGFTPPGVAGVVHVPYKFILLLLGSVARVDGSALVGGCNPLRGTFAEAWIEAAFQRLDTLGAFTPTFAALEELIESMIDLVQTLAVYPAKLVITAPDYLFRFNWVPGHFGPLAAQPWCCGLQFDHVASGPATSLRALFMFLYELAPFYVRSQVTAAGGSFVLMSQAYLVQMEKYAGLAVAGAVGAMDTALS